MGSVPTMRKLNVAVLGAGSWGTALALQLAYSDPAHQVTLWGRDKAHLAIIAAERRNQKYLPDALFPENLMVEVSLEKAVQENQLILLATPSHSFEALLEQIQPYIKDQQLLSATKGLCHGKLLHSLVQQYFPQQDYALLSGPSFSKEVAAKLPTTVIIASENIGYAKNLAQIFSNEFFRVYTSQDIIGVEVGGAVKNVLAVAVGISDGMGFGANARAALITRGLAEMQLLGRALGGEEKTLGGLSGLGDLVLTCTDNQSRNRRFGLAVGAGKNIQEAQAEIAQVVESVGTALETYRLAQALKVTMPITEQVYHIVHHGRAPKDAVNALFMRALKSE